MDCQLSILLISTLARVGSLMLSAPILGSQRVPWKWRILLALFAATAIHPLLEPSIAALEAAQQINDGQGASKLLTLLLSEIAIGAMLGLGVTLLLATAKTAGMLIGQLAGMQWATDADTESAEPISAISQLFGIVSIAVFVMVGGVELVLSALIESYRNIPIGTPLTSATGLQLLGELLRQSFLLVLRGVAPAMAALLISTIVIGMLSRAFPFMNMLGLGFNSNQFLFFTSVLLTMGGCVWLFVDDVEGIMNLVQHRLAESP